MQFLIEESERNDMQVNTIDAISRVYAAGLEASNSTSAHLRREDARGDVDDFLKKLKDLGMIDTHPINNS